MKSEELENNLLKLFTDYRPGREEDWFFKVIPGKHLTFTEKKESGKFDIYFENGIFIEISTLELEKLNITLCFKKDEKDIVAKNCDGIFLTQLNGKIVLCMAELKLNINDKFVRFIKQIEGSYIKAAMLMSLLFDIKEIELVVFIGGNLRGEYEPDNDYIEKTSEYSDKPNSPEAKLKELIRNRKMKMNFPFFLEEKVHGSYRKKNTTVYHLECGGTFDMRKLFNEK